MYSYLFNEAAFKRLPLSPTLGIGCALEDRHAPLPRWNPPRSWCFVFVDSFGTSADGNFCWLSLWVNFPANLCSLSIFY